MISSVPEPCSKAPWRMFCWYPNIKIMGDSSAGPQFPLCLIMLPLRHVKSPENRHIQQGHLWKCPPGSEVTSVTVYCAALSLCSSEKSPFAAQNNPSFRWWFRRNILRDFTLLKLWNMFVQHWKKTCKCYLSLAWVQTVGMGQARCCRTFPVIKSVSVKAGFSFLHAFLYWRLPTWKLRVTPVCEHSFLLKLRTILG